MDVEEFLDRMEETNEKILQAVDILREQPTGIKELRYFDEWKEIFSIALLNERVKVAREYFCDAVMVNRVGGGY